MAWSFLRIEAQLITGYVPKSVKCQKLNKQKKIDTNPESEKFENQFPNFCL